MHSEGTAKKRCIDVSEHSDTFKAGENMATTHKLKLIDLDALAQAAECLKTLAHPHRLRMVQMLLQGRYTVGALAQSCEIPSHMASEHLRLMQRCGFLAAEKEGRCVYYTIAEPHLENIMNCIEARFGKAK
jgi:DNA-binding transcriptional ArsR family regulator